MADRPSSLSRPRCPWAKGDPLYLAYHDEEWGVPERDDRALFELLVLEGFQSGLSFVTILRKRENFRRAFSGFEPARVARYGPRAVKRLLSDPGIVRHRGKIEGAIANARALLELRRFEESFAGFVASFVEGAPKVNKWRSPSQVPDQTPESRALARALRERGFTFVGPTVCYAFMQAAGFVNDHLIGCYRHPSFGARARRRR